MTKRNIKVISDTNRELFEIKVADFIAAGNPINDMKFSTTDTQNGVMYSVLLLVASEDIFAQM